MMLKGHRIDTELGLVTQEEPHVDADGVEHYFNSTLSCMDPFIQLLWKETEYSGYRLSDHPMLGFSQSDSVLDSIGRDSTIVCIIQNSGNNRVVMIDDLKLLFPCSESVGHRDFQHTFMTDQKTYDLPDDTLYETV